MIVARNAIGKCFSALSICFKRSQRLVLSPVRLHPFGGAGERLVQAMEVQRTAYAGTPPQENHPDMQLARKWAGFLSSSCGTDPDIQGMTTPAQIYQYARQKEISIHET